ncbi:YihY family inner membrane protein [Motiliproteus sp.]|uniref:YihY family inner membrane protein n=1 Tax=Motiliproteus sp. TaxID=1898955 RepID=UPI003BA99503
MKNLTSAIGSSTSLGFLRHLFQQFIANQGILNAAAMTYTTLFAVVPMMTVTYAMLASVPSFQGLGPQLESMIFDNFVPSTGAAVKEYLSGFAGQARSLTGIGILFLVITAFMMLKSIEKTFNRIWQVREPRRGLPSFLIYWAVLSLGPVLLGLGLGLTSYVTSLPLVSDATDVIGGRERLLALLPLLLSGAAFTLLYAAVPNCTVRLRHAMVGGLLSALLFEAAKRGFAMFVSLSPSYQLVYGAFAAVPLFLLWIYISWIIVLLGAQFVRCLSTYDSSRRGIDAPPLYWGLAMMEQLWRAQQLGHGLYESQLARRLPGLSVLLLSRYLEELKRAGMVSVNHKGQYLLCRDLHTLTLEQFQSKLHWPLPDALSQAYCDDPQHWSDQLRLSLAHVTDFRVEQLGTNLAQLFGQQRETVKEIDSKLRTAAK